MYNITSSSPLMPFAASTSAHILFLHTKKAVIYNYSVRSIAISLSRSQVLHAVLDFLPSTLRFLDAKFPILFFFYKITTQASSIFQF